MNEFTLSFIEADLDALMTNGTYSRGLAIELAFAINDQPLPQSSRHVRNVDQIFDEIAILEKTSQWQSQMKPAACFNRPILRGLWHKHFNQADFMTHNVFAELRRDRTVERLFKDAGGVMSKDRVAVLVNEILFKNMEKRGAENRMTGEWIVFSRKDEANHYLTLATHEEDDRTIRDRVDSYIAADLKPKNT